MVQSSLKVRTDKQEGDVRCRMCKDREESSERSKLSQLEYKKRHDRVAGIVHGSLCERYGLPLSEQRYQHMAEPVTEMEKSRSFGM